MIKKNLQVEIGTVIKQNFSISNPGDFFVCIVVIQKQRNADN